MSIILHKALTDYYPCHNDAWINFYSNTVVNPTVASIVFAGIDSEFRFAPNINGAFDVNLKDVAKTLVTSFEDVNKDIPTEWLQSITDNTFSLSFTVTITNANNATDSDIFSQSFSNSVKNIGDFYTESSNEILMPSTNGVDYFFTYFEGYPMFFDYKKMIAVINDGVIDFSTIKLVNTNTGYEFEIKASSVNSQRMYIDKATDNLTTLDLLPITKNENHIEVYINDVFKHNLYIKKVSKKCGVYLKWRNDNGGFSFHLFEKTFVNELKSRNSGAISRNSFNNISDGLRSTYFTTGKTVNESISVSAIVDSNEVKNIRELIKSPYVEMWSKNEPYKTGDWIYVDVDGDISYNDNEKKHEISMNLILPSQNTMML